MGAPKPETREEPKPPPPAAAPVPEKKADPPASNTFKVTVTKDATSRLGVDVDLTDGIFLLIDKVNPGIVDDWNKRQPDNSTRVEVGHKIITVNGVTGNAQAMTEICKKDDKLEMVVERS